jgi:hypothetical protein
VTKYLRGSEMETGRGQKYKEEENSQQCQSATAPMDLPYQSDQVPVGLAAHRPVSCQQQIMKLQWHCV